MDASEPFSVETVLAPVDGSEESAVAAEYAVAVADRYDASIHVLFVLGRGLVEGMNAGTVDEADVADSSQRFLEDVRALAEAYEVAISTSASHGFSPKRKTRHPGSVVLDAADTAGADFIVIPREPMTNPSTEVLEKAAEYVLSYASQPVLSI